ncbi:unnamed protein product [Brassica rapa subsp. trilocularis]
MSSSFRAFSTSFVREVIRTSSVECVPINEAALFTFTQETKSSIWSMENMFHYSIYHQSFGMDGKRLTSTV